MIDGAGFYPHHSNDLTLLADRLGVLVAERQAADPLRKVVITVPHPGLGVWLQHHLAKRQGAVANLAFSQPAATIWSLVRARSEHELVDPAEQLWSIYRALPQIDGMPLPMDQPLARYRSARLLAGLFTDYAAYRPDTLCGWQSDQAAHWQAQLWRTVVPTDADPACALLSLPQKLAGADEALLRDAELWFGVTQLPPAFAHLLQSLAEHRPVHFLSFNPSQSYWADAMDEKSRLRSALRNADPGEALMAAMSELDNALLAGLGQQGRLLQEVLLSHTSDAVAERDELAYREPGSANLLGAIQQSLLDNLPLEDASVDDSVQLHSAHSPLREVEVLHDRILRWRAAGIASHEILVLAPDMDSYASHIRSVFGPSEIAFNLSDRSAGSAWRIIEAFLRIVALATSQFRVNEVLSVLSMPPVSRRTGIDQADLANLGAWLSELNVHWGLDAAHRAEHDIPGGRLNTWHAGLTRMLLGAAISSGDILDGYLPSQSIEGMGAEAVGELALFIHTLKAFRESIRQSADADEWREILRQLIQNMLRADPEDPDQREGMDVLFEAVDSLPAAEDIGEPLAWPVVHQHLRDTLSTKASGRQYLSRGVTFAGLVPLRSVPARVVCLLGMNADSFPRPAPPRPFDLMRERPRAGDRWAVDEDRYLFLEALCAAREVFYVSYQGRDIRDNQPQAASSVVRQLTSFLAAGGVELKAVQHPLLAASPTAFDPANPERQTHDARLVPLARGLQQGKARQVFMPAPDRLPRGSAVDEVSLSELSSYLRKQQDWWARNHYQWPSQGAALEEDHVLHGLNAYQLREALRDVELGLATRERLLAGGGLPDGYGAELHLQRCDMSASVALAQPLLAQRQFETRDYRVEIDGTELRGTVQPGDLVQISPSDNFDGRYVLRLLLPWLMANASGDETEAHLITAECQHWALPGCSAGYARQWLDELLQVFRAGQADPLWLFPRAGYGLGRLSESQLRKALERDLQYEPAAHLAVRGHALDEVLGNAQFQQLSQMVFGRCEEAGLAEIR